MNAPTETSTPEMRAADMTQEAGEVATPWPIRDVTPSSTPSFADSQFLPRLPAGEVVAIDQFHMLDESTGWAIAGEQWADRHVIRTEDGGQTWIDVSPPVAPFSDEGAIPSMNGYFADAENAWVFHIANRESSLWRTSDGGSNWERSWNRMATVPVGDTTWPLIQMLDNDRGWLLIDSFLGAGSSASDLFRTSDAGSRWELIMESHRPAGAGWLPGSIGGMHFVNAQYGWATHANGSTSGVAVLWTTDGGANWSHQSLPLPGELERDLSCWGDSLKLFSVNSGMLRVRCSWEGQNLLFYTADKGRTWEANPMPDEFKRFVVQIMEPSFVRALALSEGIAGEPGDALLLESRDRGRTWSELAQLESVYDLYFIDRQTGWILGSAEDGTRLLKTIDGGRTFTEVLPTTSPSPELRDATPPWPMLELRPNLEVLTTDNVSAVASDGWKFEGLTDAAFHPTLNYLAIAERNGWISLWKPGESERPMTVHRHNDWVYGIDFSDSGTPFASASKDGSVWQWLFIGDQFGEIVRGPREATSVAVSPDGSIVAAGFEDGSLELWDPDYNLEREAYGRLLATWKGHDNPVWDLAFSPDGRNLASASSDRMARIWTVENQTELHALPGHNSAVYRLAFSPDGKILATASWDGSVKFWNPPTGKLIRTLEEPSNPSYYSLAYSIDGSMVAAGADNGKVTIWDTATGEQLNELPTPSQGIVRGLDFSADGKLLVTATEDGWLSLFAVSR